MGSKFSKLLKSLKSVYNRFDEISNAQKLKTLLQISKTKLADNKSLIDYVDALMFICAHPSDKKILSLVENELLRIATFLKKKKNSGIFTNTGLPFSKTITRFSHDFLKWLYLHSSIKTDFDSFENPTIDLNDALSFTLPSLEIADTTEGYDNETLFKNLLINKQQHLPFLLDEFSKLDEKPFIKDYLFNALDMYVNLLPLDKSFSKIYNRLENQFQFFHSEIMKNFDHEKLMNTELPKAKLFSPTEKKQAINTIKKSMALTMRETDTSTYMDENSFRLYKLERGISVAIYGMIPERQIPLESYIGYTLFKNGFPAAYGGGWVFGERALFGINIFEAFRRGESGYVLCQLLRVYKQVFQLNYFEVEPYQYGKDNPEGIESGAFWFYYRYGFRPLDKKLLSISIIEHKKIISTQGYHTNKKILEQFTKSNIALNLGKEIPIKVASITSKVKKLIHDYYKSSRSNAEKHCVMRFELKTGLTKRLNANEKQVLKEIALWTEAMEINESDKLNLLCEMIKTKPTDAYKYQELLLNFFKK